MHIVKTLLKLLGGVVLLLGVGVLGVYFQTKSLEYTDASLVPHSEVALVLGASVIGTSTLSGVLKERADAALMLYRAHAVDKILVSGDNSVNHNEVDPVKAYLVAAEVPGDKILLDRAGFDTYSSVYRAQKVYGVKTVTVVSQNFHLPRALFIAEALGLSAHGFVAGKGGEEWSNDLREVPAWGKALYDVATKRVP